MKYYFAPMEGITTHVFRAVHSRRFPGADRYYTPFFSPTSDHLFTPRELRELTPEIAEAFQLPKVAGVLIAGVLQDGPAGRAGVRPGDVVVKIGDTPVATPQQLQTAVSKLQPQEEATLSVQRGGEQLELRLRVAQRPSVARPQQPR